MFTWSWRKLLYTFLIANAVSIAIFVHQIWNEEGVYTEIQFLRNLMSDVFGNEIDDCIDAAVNKDYTSYSKVTFKEHPCPLGYQLHGVSDSNVETAAGLSAHNFDAYIMILKRGVTLVERTIKDNNLHNLLGSDDVITFYKSGLNEFAISFDKNGKIIENCEGLTYYEKMVFEGENEDEINKSFYPPYFDFESNKLTMALVLKNAKCNECHSDSIIEESKDRRSLFEDLKHYKLFFPSFDEYYVAIIFERTFKNPRLIHNN